MSALEWNERIIAIISFPASYVSHSSDKIYLYAGANIANGKVFCEKWKLHKYKRDKEKRKNASR